VTRTGIGHDATQSHSFNCPGCKVEIRYTLRLDQAKGSIEYLVPTNATYAPDEDGAAQVLVFYPGVPVPDPTEPFLSPFVQAFRNFLDYDAYQKDEAARRQVIRQDWPTLKRIATHYRHGDWALYDKAFSQLTRQPAEETVSGRRRQLASVLHITFRRFTDLTPGVFPRLNQRFAYAYSKAPELVMGLLTDFVSDGRLERTWQEISAVRDRFVTLYPHIQPLIATRYWSAVNEVDTSIALPDKAFDLLRQFYVDAFETACRLLAPALILESIIVDGTPTVRFGKNRLNLRQLYELDNAPKVSLVKDMPIGDVFVSRLDSTLRNGLAHHAAHLDGERDCVVFFTKAKNADRRHEIGYTQCCGKALAVFAALEAATVYFDTLDIAAIDVVP